MSLPTSKPAQLSIRSFFQAKTPKYAPPPASSNNNNNIINNTVQGTTPPPPPVTSAPPSTASAVSDSASPLPPTPNLPREAAIRSITTNDINPLRRLNSLLLPVSYPDTFYQRAADPSTGRFSRVITWTHDGDSPKIIGALVCRVEPDMDTNSSGRQIFQNIYIQSLCLLSPYRSMGLIAAALDTIIATAVTDPSLNVETVTAHVWTENDDGLHWYEARGFKRQQHPIKGYYLKLRPDSAWLVSRPVSASVRSALPSSAAPPAVTRPVMPSTTAAVMNLLPVSNPSPADSDVSSSTRPSPRVGNGQSYQNQRAETEWNDLPADMAPSLLAPPKRNGSEPGSSASSRSSSAARKKKDRSYPAAAYGS